MQNALNVFSGKEAVKEFLHPDNHPMLPLVEIPECLNPFAADGVRIYAKLMNVLPLANIKSLPALNMLLEKEARGELKDISHLIENSSGNTVFSLGILARQFGIETTKAIASHEVSHGKLQLLRFFGVEVMVNEEPICPDPSDKDSGIHKAKHAGQRSGWWNPGQYENEANPAAHQKWTGPQILRQTEGALTVFCAGLGTTGTMVGAGGYLKQNNPNVTTVGVVRKPNNPVPGVRTQNLLREIAFDWKGAADEVIEIGTKDSFEQSLLLCRHGILAGPSSGFSLAGALEFLKQKKESKRLDQLRNANGEIIVVFICPDSPFPYVEEYFEYLDAHWFPIIENEHLLQNGNKNVKTIAAEPSTDLPFSSQESISPVEACERIYGIPPSEIWKYLNHDQAVALKPSVHLIDTRDVLSFAQAHLPQARRIEYQDLLTMIEIKGDEWKIDEVYIICPYGNRSRVIASLLRKQGIRAFSIEGGMLEWSRLNLPRWKPEACRLVGSASKESI